jgi:hypothetical protein
MRSKWDEQGDNTSEEDICPKRWVSRPQGDSDENTSNPGDIKLPTDGGENPKAPLPDVIPDFDLGSGAPLT